MTDSHREALTDHLRGMIFSGDAPAIALFEGSRQVTPWQPYDRDENTAVISPEDLRGADSDVTVRIVAAADDQRGVWFLIETDVGIGDEVRAPHPSTWELVSAR